MARKTAPRAASLLVELLTEELPPKSLALLGKVFADEIANGLIRHQLKDKLTNWQGFATPRRLAVLIPGVQAMGEDRATEITGPSVKAPPEAVAGFARKHGLDVKDLEQHETPRGVVYLARASVKGASLDAVLANVVNDAIKKLPIPKVMRWGTGEAQFVRPAHGLVMLHGTRLVPGTVLGLESTSSTSGHRFMGKREIRLAEAEDYAAALHKDGKVIADFAARRAEIDAQLQAAAKREKASLGSYQDLLDEVAALVEWPEVYAGGFAAEFLGVPPECLILTMRKNQKYFPLFDAAGKLLPRFLIVSNMKVADPRHIVGGNERVVRPRLEDARFFFDQDRRTRLDSRVPELAKVVHHNKLGSQLDRVQRIEKLAAGIANGLGVDVADAERSAHLSKSDLLTGMVGEFPELQGVMGRYYALHDGEKPEVADALAEHYKPRFAGDALPEGALACALALADKLDTLAGLFGIKQAPTGERDPFGLRRAALGVIRILVERRLVLSLHDLVNSAFAAYGDKIGDARTELQGFVLDRFAGYLKDQGFSSLQVEAVLSQNPTRLDLVPLQLEAVKAFQALPEAESLAAANKRVANILKQAEAKGESFGGAERDELKEAAEIALFDALQKAAGSANPLFERGDYAGYLRTFAVLKAPVDAFFDQVMVMVEDPKLRQGRLALLRDLREAMNRVADISRLAQ